MLCLIDPSLQDHRGSPSTNLGDVVISRAILRELNRLFPGEPVHRISSHEPLTEQHYAAIDQARLLILGGSNLLSSDVLAYNQWDFTRRRADYDHPRFRNALLFGIGWWQYQPPATPFTADFYRRILDPNAVHSVRDSFTAARLSEAGIEHTAVTGCPSMWTLDGVACDRTTRWTEDCLVMLTDYYTRRSSDERLLGQLLEHFAGTLFFYPQGEGDIAYLRSLSVYRRQASRFQVLDHSLGRLERFLASHPVTLVGTRLHGGITALHYRVPTLILGVDNRALEMGRDFHLPVIPRNDAASLEQWLRGERTAEPVRVPHAAIERWRAQFPSTAII